MYRSQGGPCQEGSGRFEAQDPRARPLRLPKALTPGSSPVCFWYEIEYQVEHHLASGGAADRPGSPGQAQGEEQGRGRAAGPWLLHEVTEREALREAYRRASRATRASLSRELSDLDPLVDEGLSEP